MAPSERFCGRLCATLLAGALVLGLAACGDKSPPESVAKPAPLTAQPVPQAMPEKEEPKMAAPQLAPAAAPVNPDEELAVRVKSELGSDGGINVHRIDVAAQSGVVTLYGTADTAEQRAKAAQIASGVPGVKSVQNKLAIVAGS